MNVHVKSAQKLTTYRITDLRIFKWHHRSSQFDTICVYGGGRQAKFCAATICENLPQLWSPLGVLNGPETVSASGLPISMLFATAVVVGFSHCFANIQQSTTVLFCYPWPSQDGTTMQIARLPDIDEGTWEDVKKYVEGTSETTNL